MRTLPLVRSFVVILLITSAVTGCTETSVPTGPAYPTTSSSKGSGPTGPSQPGTQYRAPDPEPGSRLPAPDMSNVVAEVAAAYPDALRNSCQEHGGSWEFMDLVVDALRQHDTRWGYNWKRGQVGDPSLDVVNYHWSSGQDEGSPDVYTFDVIIGHCGDYPAVAWIDLTDPHGSGARWTGRGRF